MRQVRSTLPGTQSRSAGVGWVYIGNICMIVHRFKQQRNAWKRHKHPGSCEVSFPRDLLSAILHVDRRQFPTPVFSRAPVTAAQTLALAFPWPRGPQRARKPLTDP